MRARQRKNGSLLIAALMLFVLLLALGLGLMSTQSNRMKEARAQALSVQAKQLCLAAWQDARVKLGTDILFPPQGVLESFAYSEDVSDGEGNFVGTYTVVIDVRFARPFRDVMTGELTQGLYLVTCNGKVGERGFEPEAERTMYYELDMNNFKVIRFEDRGSL